MLSYQHSYHAGGPADVHKHVALVLMLAHLTAKAKPAGSTAVGQQQLRRCMTRLGKLTEVLGRKS